MVRHDSTIRFTLYNPVGPVSSRAFIGSFAIPAHGSTPVSAKLHPVGTRLRGLLAAPGQRLLGLSPEGDWRELREANEGWQRSGAEQKPLDTLSTDYGTLYAAATGLTLWDKDGDPIASWSGIYPAEVRRLRLALGRPRDGSPTSRVWVAHPDMAMELDLQDPGRGVLQRLTLDDVTGLNAIAEDSAGRLWVGTDRELYLLDPERLEGVDTGPCEPRAASAEVSETGSNLALEPDPGTQAQLGTSVSGPTR
ncbi:two-component regulator propeller domain-containing protein [Candidatus Thiosymbion oneisti]|uniref:two-component regulator propeller domain-containing protein n=1 Tax=Candidatus Thiosymbion oneisti TaxID=589554 RepID=UPI000B7CE37E|nr:two-component regulator propeller domain-containing protein [Candidatus Thiosymbion oneisti]